MRNIRTVWTNDKTLQLIALFKERPVLWDKCYRDYENRQKRRKVIAELAVYVNIKKDEVHRKLKNLQIYFYRQIKKEEKAKSKCPGRIKTYRSKWFAYQPMRFLIDRRNQNAADNDNTPVAPRRAKSIEATSASTAGIHSDESCRYSAGTCHGNSEYQTESSPSRNSPKTPVKEKETTACYVNDVVPVDFLYVDMNQENKLDNSQIDFWEEKIIDSEDPIELTAEMNKVQLQPQLAAASFVESQTNPNKSTPNSEQDQNAIAPMANKAHDLNDSELNFYRGLIPDITKLSDRRRRQFKEVQLCTLNKLLDEDEKDRAET